VCLRVGINVGVFKLLSKQWISVLPLPGKFQEPGQVVDACHPVGDLFVWYTDVFGELKSCMRNAVAQTDIFNTV